MTLIVVKRGGLLLRAESAPAGPALIRDDMNCQGKDTPVPALASVRPVVDQDEVLHGLMTTRGYPHEVGTVERIETHISTVLLAGAYAYKLKKPLDLGFLDFSTLASRRHYCEEELRLNSRLAPDVYLRVVAIVGVPREPRIVATDDPLAADALEFAVQMRRFDQAALLDRMLDAGEMTPHHVDALAATVAEFHQHIDRVADQEFGKPDHVAAPMRQNFSQIRPLLTSADEIDALDTLERWSIAEHQRLTPLMEARRRDGCVRECHGDLHLGNITWIKGAIHVFDCIEFNPELRWIDVVSEISFAMMDFDVRGRPDWGARFLNEYLEITGDYSSLQLLTYYLVYRCMVRAKIARIRASQGGSEADDAAMADYAAHIRLARSYVSPRLRAIIITHGVSGSGKSSATLRLVERLAALRVRSDVERKRLRGMDRDAKSNSAIKSGLYGAAASIETYAELRRLAAQITEAGFPAIVDATFLHADQRSAFRAIANDLGVPFIILDFRAETDELRRRVNLRQIQGYDASEATAKVLEYQLLHDEPLDAGEMDHALVIDTQHMTSEDLIAALSVSLAHSRS